MPSEIAETVHETVYSGLLSLGALVAVGIVLAVIVGLMAWRESRFVDRRVMALLAVLRIVAVLVVLWMLAEPVSLTKVRRTRAKQLMFLVDTSASMGIVDPVDDASAADRWTGRYISPGYEELFADIDGAVAAVRAADRHFARLREACQGAAESTTVEQSAELVLRSVETAVRHLETGLSRMPDRYAAVIRELEGIRARLGEFIAPRLSELAEELDSGELVLDTGWGVRLSEIQNALAGQAEQLLRAADGLASLYAQDADRDDPKRRRKHETTTRIEKVVAFLKDAEDSWLSDLEKKLRVTRYRFDSSAQPVPLENWSQALETTFGQAAATTDLAAALEQVARDAAGGSVAAAVILSDGAHNAARDPLKLASGMSVPVYTVPIGNTVPLRDVILHHVQGPRAVFKDDLIAIEATIDAYECAGQELVVELLANDKVLDSTPVAVTSNTFARRLTFAPKADELGIKTFLLRVGTVPDEHVSDNNVGQVSVEVIEGKIHVLLADHMPRWEYRYLRNLFKRDNNVEFSELLLEPRHTAARRPKEGQGFPQDLNGWTRYRVVILGDVSPGALTPFHQDLLEEYVAKRGRAVIMIAGRKAMPGAYAGQTLERMLPVDLMKPSMPQQAGYELSLTAEGSSASFLQLADDPLTSERVWREMSSRLPIYNLSEYSHPKPTSHVLIAAVPRAGDNRQSADDRAFLCWHQYGKGRILYLSSPVTYRFRYRYGDYYHHRFWGQLLRWATAREMAGGSKTVRLTTDKLRYEMGEDLQVGKIELVEDEQDPGVYRGILRELPSGTITIQAAGADVQSLFDSEGYAGQVGTDVNVDPASALELRNTRCNLPLLKQIAESSGGQLIPPTGLRDAVSLLDLSPDASEIVTRRPLWTRWWCLLIFLGCLTVEWIVRKFVGLV